MYVTSQDARVRAPFAHVQLDSHESTGRPAIRMQVDSFESTMPSVRLPACLSLPLSHTRSSTHMCKQLGSLSPEWRLTRSSQLCPLCVSSCLPLPLSHTCNLTRMSQLGALSPECKLTRSSQPCPPLSLSLSLFLSFSLSLSLCAKGQGHAHGNAVLVPTARTIPSAAPPAAASELPRAPPALGLHGDLPPNARRVRGRGRESTLAPTYVIASAPCTRAYVCAYEARGKGRGGAGEEGTGE